MRTRSLFQPAAALALVTSLGCSLLVDASELDHGCEPGQKACDGECVEEDDPAFGCGASCNDACDLPNAFSTCVDDACAIAVCIEGYGNCTGESGCETNILFDMAHCGGCSRPCAEGYSCQNGQCVNVDAGAAGAGP